jgi:hypothetical protein
MAESTRARYEVASVPTSHTQTELAHHWIAELKVATDAATPAGAADAWAIWSGTPTDDDLVTAHNYDTLAEAYRQDGINHIVVCAGADKDTTATIACVASAITNVASTITEPIVDAAATEMTLADASLYTDLVEHAASATNPIYVHLTVGNEIVKITGIAGEVATIVRGCCGTTATTHLDNAVVHFTLGLDDRSVPVTAALPLAAAEVPYTVICGTEQMRVTASTATTLTVTRGYDGTTAAVHADGATVVHYIDEATPSFNVSNGALLVDECLYKTAVAGTEVWKVKSIAGTLVHVTRGCYNTVPTVMANGAAPYRLWGPEIYDAALTAVNTIADGTFQEGGFGACNVTLGLNPQEVAWSTETQPEEA